MPETLVEQAKRIHLAHVVADGTGGHSAPDEWRNCANPTCAAFRESVSGRRPAWKTHVYSAAQRLVQGANAYHHMGRLATAGQAAANAARAHDGQELAVVSLDGPPLVPPGPAEQEAANRAYAASRAAGLAPAEALEEAWRAALAADQVPGSAQVSD